MSNAIEILAKRLGPSPADLSVIANLADTTELIAVDTTLLSTGTTASLADGTQYYLNKSLSSGGIAPTLGGGRWLLLAPNGQGVNVKAFGAVGDGVTDDIAAFEAAFASFPFQDNGAGLTENNVGGTVYVPRGIYYLSRTLYITRQNSLLGEGGGSYTAMPTVIKFATGCHGIVIWTSGLGTLVSPYRRGIGNILRHLFITKAAGGGGFYNGVSSLAGGFFENVWVNNFTGNGFYFQSAVNASNPAWCQLTNQFTQEDGTFGGGNNWNIKNCNATNCGGDGLRIVGGDTNGGTSENFVAQVCTGVGISDQSAIGCTHIGFLPEGNLLGAFQSVTEAGNCTVISSNMAEGNGSEANRYSVGTVFFGCLVPAQFAGSPAPKSFRSASGHVETPTLSGGRALGGTSGTSPVLAYFYGKNANAGSPLTEFWGNSGEQETQIRFNYDDVSKYFFWDIQSAGRPVIIFANNYATAAFRMKVNFESFVMRRATLWDSGAGSPEGVLAAPVGSLYTRTDGGANTTLYIKESGTGNTGWVAK